MKSCTPAMLTLLNNSTEFNVADLLTITLQNGTVLTYTDYDQGLTVNSVFYGADVGFTRSKTKTEIGVTVDELDLVLYVSRSNMAGVPWSAFANSGGLDGARIRIDRTFMATQTDTSAGSIAIFSGRISECKIDRYQLNLKVSSDIILLNIQMPRNVYEPPCLHTLYDDDMLALGYPATGCKLNKSSFSANITFGAGCTQTVLQTGLGSSKPDEWFEMGYLVFNTGTNNTLKRTIKDYTAGVITLSYPVPSPPISGDGAIGYAGCDHTQATCQSKFNNLVNFRGFPYVPAPETGV